MSDSFGENFRITVFGESHGSCIGAVIDGCPAGLQLSEEDIQIQVDKRKPFASAGQTSRVEEDKVEILSGVYNGNTTGAPLCLMVRNKDTDSSNYEKTRFTPRPGHADYTSFIKYGGFNDFRGGGRFSGRVTVGLVMVGAVAKKLLNHAGIEVFAHTVQISDVKTPAISMEEIKKSNVYNNPMRCIDELAAKEMLQAIEEAGKEGDSVGGVIEGIALNVPIGLGEPYFDTIEGQMAKALFAVPAVKAVEFGSGFTAANKRGSENNDLFDIADHRIITRTNNAGGILGGITNGMPLVLRTALKATPSIARPQATVDMLQMENTEIEIKGRHDVCIVPRAVIVVESMMAVTLCDFAMRANVIERIIR
jgi:chorismate synthase